MTWEDAFQVFAVTLLAVGVSVVTVAFTAALVLEGTESIYGTVFLAIMAIFLWVLSGIGWVLFYREVIA